MTTPPTSIGKWRGQPVVVLYGGPSNEREVSLRTGAACATALETQGYRVERLDFSATTPADLMRIAPAVVFLALHGTPGEDGTVQGLLEVMGIPYTGSGVLASALAMDKVRAKQVFDAVGVPTPRWTVVAADAATAPWLPCVVKPSLEGSSVGVALVRTAEDWSGALAKCAEGRGQVLVEEWIDGDELTVGLMEGQILGDVRIAAEATFFDYDAKYTRGDTRYEVPAQIDATVRAAVHAAALGAWQALGCRGVGRVDVMLRDGQPKVLEVNTLPGMTASSLVPKMARANGMSFETLCELILDGARTDAQEARR